MAITRYAADDPQDNTSLAWSTIAPSAGDLVIVIFANDGGDNQSGLADFNRVGTNAGSSIEAGVYYRICTGSESGNVFTNETSFGVSGEEYAWHAFKVPAAEWHGTTPPEMSTEVNSTTGTTANPAAIAPSWGAETDTLFITWVARDDDDGITSAPSGYANFLRSEGGSSGPELGTAWRVPAPAVESEDAGTWSVVDAGTNEEHITATIAVRPLSGPAIASIDTDNDTVDTRTGVTIAGAGFGASETGSAKVEISDNATYGSGIVVEVDVTAWAATSITVTLRQESDSAALATLFTLPLDPAYLWVTDSAGSRNTVGFQFTLRAPGPTAIGDANTGQTLDVDTTYLIRARVQNSGGIGATAFRWIYSHEGGAWTPVTTSSDVVRAVNATTFADGDDVPEVIGGNGSYASNNDAASEDGTPTLPAGFPASGAVEFVLSFQIVGEDVADEDTIQLRVELADGTDFTTYTNTPSITVNKEAGDVTLTPASGQVRLLGQSVSPEAGAATTPDTGTLQIAGQAPTVSADATAATLTGVVELTGLAPSVAADALATPSGAAVEIVGQAPTVAASALNEPGVDTLAITGLAPTVSVSGDIAAAPETGSLAVVGVTPTVVASAVAVPDVGAVELTGHEPSVAVGGQFEGLPPAGELEIAGQAPSIASDQVLALDVGALETTGFAPTVAADAAVATQTAAVEITGLEPEVLTLADGTSQPGVGSLQVAGVLPVVVAAVQVEPTPGAVELEVFAPTVAAGAGTAVEPETGALEITGAAPAVARGAELTPAVTSVEVSGLAPTTESSHQIETATGVAVITGFAPSVIAGTGAIVTTQTGTMVIVGQAPTFAGHVFAAANDGNLVLVGFAPELQGERVIEVPSGSMAVTGYPPFAVYLPAPERRQIRVAGRAGVTVHGPDRLVPVGAPDRQAAVTGRRRVFRVGGRGGSSAA